MMAEANTSNTKGATAQNANDTDASKTSGARAQASTKLNDARDAAGDYAQRAAEVIESNPIAVVAGGLAAGLVAGALIPRSDREREALAPLGKKLSDGAHAAVQAARETGKAQLTASLLSPDAAKESARAVFDSAVQAAKGGEPTSTGDKGQSGESSQANAQANGGQSAQDTSKNDRTGDGQARPETSA